MPGGMSSTVEKRAEFRRLHDAGCFVMPNCFDVGSARLIQALGFPAAASSSAGLAWTIGKSDNHISIDNILGHLTAVCAPGTCVVAGEDMRSQRCAVPPGR